MQWSALPVQCVSVTCVEQHEAACAVGVLGLTRGCTLAQQCSHLVTQAA